ncbi:MAG TPA: hypothetical protein GYA06_08175 [Chloroflexi bacterium]|jgi:hypothetical protein|nr:hypothetical protein [Chloroflexota bacterium]
MAFTLDTPLGELLDHPQARPIIDKYVPGLVESPMVGMLKGMTINMVLSMPQAIQLGITKDKAEQMLAEVNKRLG